MKYHELPNHPLKLSSICFGGASISGEGKGYGFGSISERDSIDLVLKSYDQGINFFDTAPIYGFNESERRLSLALNNIRENVTIVSKCGVDWHTNGRVNMSNDPKICQKMLDQSLKFHHYIDIYMIHWPDKNIDIRYPLEVLQKAKDKKDIKHIGLCNTNEEDLLKAQEICEINFIQSEVNLFNNQLDSIKQDAYKMGWGTFDKGILTGSVKLDRKFDSDDCRHWAPWWKKSNWKQKVQKVESLEIFVKKHDMTLLEFSLAFSQSQVDSSICGFKTSQQLDQIINAIDKNISNEILEKGRKILE